MEDELRVWTKMIEGDVKSLRADVASLRKIVWTLTIGVAALAAAIGAGRLPGFVP